MKTSAVIFDLYHTLLEVTPSLVDRRSAWFDLWGRVLGTEPIMEEQEFGEATKRCIERERAAARSVGVEHPEVFWPHIVGLALPQFRAWERQVQIRFMNGYAAIDRQVRVEKEAADLLRELKDRGVRLGIASNCQPYTHFELEKGFSEWGLGEDLFDSDLTFLSYMNGFGKPDVLVFRLLGARLKLRGIERSAALMVGDRVDNDIEPAQSQGWQTWHLRKGTGPWQSEGGDWKSLTARLRQE